MNKIHYVINNKGNEADNLTIDIIGDYVKRSCMSKNYITCKNCNKDEEYLIEIKESKKEDNRTIEENYILKPGNVKGRCKENYKEEEFKIITIKHK
jgi:hypothetical protein